MFFKEFAFLGAVLTTAILIRARSVVQVHPGPPKLKRSGPEVALIYVSLAF
jgi:hypothetical protein